MTIKRFFISPIALSFWFPAVIMLTYYAYRGMAPFGTNSILTVDLGQQYIDQFAAFKTVFWPIQAASFIHLVTALVAI